MKTRKMIVLPSLILVLFLFASVAAAWTTSDPGYSLEYARSERGVLPEFVAGNTPDTVAGFTVFKQDYNENGFVLSSGTDPELFTFVLDATAPAQVLRVWLSRDENGVIHVYRWESDNIAVKFFFVKGGPNYLVYTYPNGYDYDQRLYSPKVGVDQTNIADISHITIVYTAMPDETTVGETTTIGETTTAGETTTLGETTTAGETTTLGETSETLVLTDPSVPQVEPTTSQSESAATVTTVNLTTTTMSGTTAIDDEALPQTGETGQGVLIGAVILALAAGLFAILHHQKKQSN